MNMKTPRAFLLRLLVAASLMLALSGVPAVYAGTYDFPQKGFVGTWKSADEKEKVTITEQHGKYSIKGRHTDWEFDLYNAEKGKMYFKRKPRSGEMNPTIPVLVQNAANGKLEWLLELVIDAHTVPGQVSLSGTLFPGKVEWEENRQTGQKVDDSTVRVTSGSKDDPDGLKLARMIKEPRPLPPSLVLAGDKKDIEDFRLILEDCRTRSEIFDRLIEKREGKNKVVLGLGRGQKSVWVDHFKGGNKKNGWESEINLNQIMEFPCSLFDGDRKPIPEGRWYYPDRKDKTPYWACSRCEILTHILAEVGSAADQNLKDMELPIGCHQKGYESQQELRENMGVKDSGRPDQSFEEEGFRGINIVYGGNHRETLTFDKDGKMKIDYNPKKKKR